MKKLLLLCLTLWSAALTAEVMPEGVDRLFSGLNTVLYAVQDQEMRMPSSLFKNTLKNDPVKLNWPPDWKASGNVFLIRDGRNTILIDTGYGSEKSRLLPRLASLQVKPEAVKAILITHIHPDHVGGLVDQAGKKVFPNAKVWIAEKEYSAWLKADRPHNRRMDRCLLPYRNQIKLFTVKDSLPCGIQAHDASGHTPGHTVYEWNGMLFIGDLVHAAGLQINHPTYCASYDADPAQAVKTRIAFLEKAVKEKKPVLGAHIPFPGSLMISESPNPVKLPDGTLRRAFTGTPSWSLADR